MEGFKKVSITTIALVCCLALVCQAAEVPEQRTDDDYVCRNHANVFECKPCCEKIEGGKYVGVVERNTSQHEPGCVCNVPHKGRLYKNMCRMDLDVKSCDDCCARYNLVKSKMNYLLGAFDPSCTCKDKEPRVIETGVAAE